MTGRMVIVAIARALEAVHAARRRALLRRQSMLMPSQGRRKQSLVQ